MNTRGMIKVAMLTLGSLLSARDRQRTGG